MNKTILTAVIVAVVAGGAGFAAGRLIGTRGQPPFGDRQFGAGAERFGQSTGPGTEQREFRQGMQQAVGEVLSLDATGFTLTLPGGGSRIVLVPATAAVTTAASASLQDIVVGSQVSVTGITNDDGSITANSLQLR